MDSTPNTTNDTCQAWKFTSVDSVISANYRFTTKIDLTQGHNHYRFLGHQLYLYSYPSKHVVEWGLRQLNASKVTKRTISLHDSQIHDFAW